MAWDDIEEDIVSVEADERAKLHAGSATSRPLSEQYELVGLAGEVEFGRMFQQPVDFNRRPGGDAGIDFVIPLGYTVDVKCARVPLHLIQEEGKVSADIYVLARYDDATRKAELLGWEWGSILRRAPVKDFGYGIKNHYIAAAALRPIRELQQRVMVLRPIP